MRSSRAIGEVRQRARQGEQVLDRRPMSQRLDLDRAERDLRFTQPRQDPEQVPAIAHQDRDRRGQAALAPALGERIPRDLRHATRLSGAVAVEQRMDVDRVVFGAMHGLRGRVGHRAAMDVFRARHDPRESRVDPIDNPRMGAEVGREREGLETNAADSVMPCAQEETDFGLAEAVDRLHGIADQEERAAILRLPTRGELFDQLELRV